ncbi:MAG: ACP S-malonyltransferase [Phycisphaerales bacterium]|jgi:[acyl-carrier-protein] S-malonyltransferase|nr:ACP S-malonyltransferase [Phycisphaerales bacterium]MDP6891471.1 ACP S-malonyltransferase [Phycisphaerales bacterium]
MNTINVTALCPGQGAQAVGMGSAWFEASEVARAVFARADETLGGTLGSPLSELCFEGPADRLNRTDVSQPAIYTCSVACWHGLHGDTAVPATAAGLSLGEYTALHLAGCFSFEDGLRLVARRGAVMQEAAEASEGGMVAVMGATEEEAETFCQELAGDGGVLVPANLNAPGQIVLSGDATCCERAVTACEEKGWRGTPLTVAGAFHSSHMQPAADRMVEVLSATPMQTPSGVVWSNVTADTYEGMSVDEIRETLVAQITSPVRWAGQLANMVAAGYDQWIELAPGKVLKGLMRRIDRSVKVQNHDQPDSTVSA